MRVNFWQLQKYLKCISWKNIRNIRRQPPWCPLRANHRVRISRVCECVCAHRKRYVWFIYFTTIYHKLMQLPWTNAYVRHRICFLIYFSSVASTTNTICHKIRTHTHTHTQRLSTDNVINLWWHFYWPHIVVCMFGCVIIIITAVVAVVVLVVRINSDRQWHTLPFS